MSNHKNASDLIWTWRHTRDEIERREAETMEMRIRQGENEKKLVALLRTLPPGTGIECYGTCLRLNDSGRSVESFAVQCGYQIILPIEGEPGDVIDVEAGMPIANEDVGSVGSDGLDVSEAVNRLPLAVDDDPPLGRVHIFDHPKANPEPSERELAHAFDAHGERDC